MPNRAQLQRLIHALGLNARQAEHLTTQYDELRSGAQAHRTDEALYELLQTAMRSRDNLMNDVLAPYLFRSYWKDFRLAYLQRALLMH